MLQRIILCLVLLSCSLSAVGQRHKLSGTVCTSPDSIPVAFAQVKIAETCESVVTDGRGHYELSTHMRRDYHLRVSAMGYITQKVAVKADCVHKDVLLLEQSYALKDVVVTAKYEDKAGSAATVGQEALEYIQPTSLKDIFTLLPGGKMGSNNMQSGALTTSRQAGADKSTSFGMGITINGIPLNNDGMRVQLSGLTGQSAMDANANVTVNRGVDMRTISTDHIETVTVTRGISSAADGNLSSGSVNVRIKQGRSPLRMRVKFDPKNKLFYVGKGFSLGKRGASVYVGADVVNSASRIEDRRGAYNRITGQVNLTQQIDLNGTKMDANLSASGVTSFNNKKTDDKTRELNEHYSTKYSRFMLSTREAFYFDHKWMDQLELTAAVNYTSNVLKHDKYVMNTSVTPAPVASAEGEHEGQYLPKSYMTYYELDNQPINSYARLKMKKYGNWGERFNYSVLLGASYDYTKNIGDGAITDPQRPPFPSSNYIRPRKNKDIPSLQHQASFAETKLTYKSQHHEWNASLGVRQVMMLNLPKNYELRGKLLFEPRMNVAYSHHSEWRGDAVVHTLRGGYGVENKLPSADYLYPDKVYRDLIAMNAYFTDPAKRRLIMHTKILDPVNPNVRENKNKKWEVGYDFEFRGLSVSLTGFGEEMRGGVQYFTEYQPFRYMYYYALKHPVDGPPSREDYEHEVRDVFIDKRVPMNSASVKKRGVEYRLHIKEIAALRSEIEINGAYYRTAYSNGVPVSYYPSILVDGVMYPYVGYFDSYETHYRTDFNTNVWVHTHLPKWKLLMTNFVQMIWTQRSYLSDTSDAFPSYYMDLNGEKHQFTPEALAKNPLLGRMERTFNSARYEETVMPFALAWNVKLTKEINKHIRLSFFADEIVSVHPKYKNAFKKTKRVWSRPFFGAEMTVSL